jgi:hypothetical protein
VNRPFTYGGHVPDRVATAVWMIQCQAGTREERSWCWEELDKHPREQALAWIRDVLVYNGVERLAEEVVWWEWWECQRTTPDN